MENICRTVYGSYLQTAQLVGSPFILTQNTTLNEKFTIQAGVGPRSGEVPKMAYFAIGNGGHTFMTGADGVAKPEPVQHIATDAALYSHLPFVLRETNNDLTAAQQANYGLRRLETHNGNQYYAYYLKRIPADTITPQMELQTVDNGVTNTTPFAPNSANLNPTPQQLSSTGVNVVTGSYTTASAVLNLTLSADDVTELLNAAQVIYNDTGYAIISEIALVSGIDRVVPVSSNGGSTINFNEVVCAQVVSFINTFFPMVYANNGTGISLDVGATEPLFGLS